MENVFLFTVTVIVLKNVMTGGRWSKLIELKITRRNYGKRLQYTCGDKLIEKCFCIDLFVVRCHHMATENNNRQHKRIKPSVDNKIK